MLRALLLSLTSFVMSGLCLAQSLVVAVPSDVLGDYRRWLGGRDVTTLASFQGDGVRRDVVEVALFRQALARGCGDVSVSWLEVDSYPRTVLLLREGRIDAAATTIWGGDLSISGARLSAAVIADGQFSAALYTAQNNPITLTGRADLARYSVVSSHHWAQDWETLQSLPFSHHHDVNDWSTMLRWVASGKADMLLAPMIPHGRSALQAFDVALTPVIGARVVLPGSRHFALRENALFAPRLPECFDRGLAELARGGRIEEAYRESGFWRADFMAWPLLRAEGDPESSTH